MSRNDNRKARELVSKRYRLSRDVHLAQFESSYERRLIEIRITYSTGEDIAVPQDGHTVQECHGRQSHPIAPTVLPHTTPHLRDGRRVQSRMGTYIGAYFRSSAMRMSEHG